MFAAIIGAISLVWGASAWTKHNSARNRGDASEHPSPEIPMAVAAGALLLIFGLVQLGFFQGPCADIADPDLYQQCLDDHDPTDR